MSKIKMKTKSSAKKRFKVTGTGKIKRAKAGKQHLNSHKSRKRKRGLAKAGYVSPALHDLTIECLPYLR